MRLRLRTWSGDGRSVVVRKIVASRTRDPKMASNAVRAIVVKGIAEARSKVLSSSASTRAVPRRALHSRCGELTE
jgi:hypothetical protein